MKNTYDCPACLYLKKTSNVKFKYNCVCTTCTNSLVQETSPIKKKLMMAYATHSKSGYRCPDCEEFLPQSLAVDNIVSCPFPNCLFSGRIDSLKKMRHPFVKVAPAPIVTVAAVDKSSPILELIDDRINVLQYTSVSCTIKQKTFVYQAFANLLKKNPIEMSQYLLDGKRGDRLQPKLFQEYVSILESNLPFTYKTSEGVIQVDSIAHPKFNPFSGVSKFDAIVEENQIIKNKTSELYIGSRKSYYCQPYYIGKLLDIVGDDGNSLLSNVIDYSFSAIRTNLKPGTKVHVSHLRIPAHYQIGILSHINRIRKSLSDSLKETV